MRKVLQKNVLVFFIIVEIHCTYCALLGGVFKICSRSYPEVNQCITDSLNAAREKLSLGVPELALPSLRPLRADVSRLDSNEGDLHLGLVFRNVTWDGLYNYEVLKSRIDFSTPHLELDTIMGPMNLSSNYAFDGGILQFRVRGSGDMEIIFEANITHRFTFKESTRGGKTFWTVSDYDWDMTITSYYSEYRNLFQGNQRLGMFINNFINKNWRLLVNVYRNIVNNGFGDTFKRAVFDKFFDTVPVEDMFVD